MSASTAPVGRRGYSVRARAVVRELPEPLHERWDEMWARFVPKSGPGSSQRLTHDDKLSLKIKLNSNVTLSPNKFTGYLRS